MTQPRANLLDAYRLLQQGAEALAIVERQGIVIDVPYCRDTIAHLDFKMDQATRRLARTDLGRAWEVRYGGKVNYESGPQLQSVLYADLHVVPFKNTQTGDGGSIDEESLRQVNLPGIDNLLQKRRYKKIRDTISGFLRYQVDGVLHPSFLLHTVTTYRSSSADPNCFPPEVEVLSRSGWVHWNEVTERTQLGQVDISTMELSFSRPEAVVRRAFCGNLVHVGTDYHISILGTSDHRVPLMDRKSDEWRWYDLGHFPGDGYKLFHAVKWTGGTVDLRWSQVALICALQADGSVSKEGGHIGWGFKKRRKFDRLRAALDAEGIQYNAKEGKRGRLNVYLPRRFIPEWMADKKHFGPWIMDLSRGTLLMFSTELCLWDGLSTRMNAFFTKHAGDADWAQLVFVLVGRRCGLRRRDMEYTKDFNFVSVSTNGYSLTSNSRRSHVPYDGTVYCATMPKGTLVIRHNGMVSVVGNCQNIPKRDGDSMELCRRAIVPRSGHGILESDFSGLEVNIAASYHRDPEMMRYLNDPKSDMHADTAVDLFKLKKYGSVAKLKTITNFSKVLRQAAKNSFVFPQFYGDFYEPCAFNVAFKWCKLPRADEWSDDDGIEFDGRPIGTHMRESGFRSLDDFTQHVKSVEDVFWNKRFRVYNRWRKDWFAEYQRTGTFDMHTGFRVSGLLGKNMVVNYPVQGAAFHCLLKVLIELVRRMRGWRSAVIGEIHDSVLIDYHPDEFQEVVALCRYLCSEWLPKQWSWINVPLRVEVQDSGIDGNWANMSVVE